MMRLFIGISSCLIAVLLSATGILAQDRLIPAGTLLQCTMSEPNFSSATAAVGDPVLCHLRTLEEFGKAAFPRGAMLGGHLEEEKDPGRLWGKGYLKITFDRVILPYGDLPVPAKIIQAKGLKVSKNGDINGKGHAKRDVAEWMMPPLWPWKLVSLPMRGPRPRLKSEEQLELRLMDDISIPATLAYGPVRPDRPPYGGSAQPSALRERRAEAAASSVNERPSMLFTMLVLKSDEVYRVTRYRIEGDLLKFEDSNGVAGAVESNKVDWLKTAEMTSEARSKLTAGLSPLH